MQATITNCYCMTNIAYYLYLAFVNIHLTFLIEALQ